MIILSATASLFIQPACSIGRRALPQSDIDTYEIGEEIFETKILLASRESDFKIAIARKIGESLGDEPVYIKFIGINQLEDENVEQYSAIILMTKCIAWGMDPKTESFLEKYTELSNIIVLITSGDGNWKPDNGDIRYDAVTSASVMENVDIVAEEILEKIIPLIGAES
jgi:hypothetical protein